MKIEIEITAVSLDMAYTLICGVASQIADGYIAGNGGSTDKNEWSYKVSSFVQEEG
jgi:hypothetical protein